MSTRIEIGTVGTPPSPSDLIHPKLPQTIVVNFAKVCNLWCTHCFYPEVATKREETGSAEERFLPADAFRAAVDETSGWTNDVVLRIVSDGEPLMHPKCMEMIAYAKQKGVRTALTTNGILLTPNTIRKLLDTRIDVIDVSIDAATPEGFERVRPSRSGFNFYAKIEENVRELIRLRNEENRTPPTRVMVNMIDQPAVAGEAALFEKKWSDWGADVVLIRPFHSMSNQKTQEGVAAPGAGVKRFPCKYPFTRLNMGFDHHGHPVVYYCSHDWEEKTVVGTLGADGNLEAIWNGANMAEIRRRHLENDYPENSFCGPCPDWHLGWGKSHQQLVREIK